MLYAEGAARAAKMLSVGLHCRLVGRPGRAAALARFLDYVQRPRAGLGLPPRSTSPATGTSTTAPSPAYGPQRCDRASFVARFGGVFEHSPWIAEAAWDAGPARRSRHRRRRASRAVRAPWRQRRPSASSALIQAHPDLAGKLAAASRLTPESTAEQAGAGLDPLTDDERATFHRPQRRLPGASFGFPFIIAVRA